MADAQACALIHFREQERLIEMEEEQKQHLRGVVEQRKRVDAARAATLRAEAAREATLRAEAEAAARAEEEPDLPENTPGFAENWGAGFGPAVGAWRAATIWVAPSLNNEEEFEREVARTAAKNGEQSRAVRTLLLGHQSRPFSELEEEYDGRVDNIRWWLNKMAVKGFVRIV